MNPNPSSALARRLVPPAIAVLAYALVLSISLRFLAGGQTEGAAAIAVSLAPMVPALVLCWTIVRLIGSLDELQRRLQLEALALAFAGTAIASFSYGFLENVGFPKLSAFAIWPVMCGLWIAGVFLGSLRYR
jgi:hypothetical protein